MIGICVLCTLRMEIDTGTRIVKISFVFHVQTALGCRSRGGGNVNFLDLVSRLSIATTAYSSSFRLEKQRRPQKKQVGGSVIEFLTSKTCERLKRNGKRHIGGS